MVVNKRSIFFTELVDDMLFDKHIIINNKQIILILVLKIQV